MLLHLPKIFFTALLLTVTAVSAQVKFTAAVSAPRIDKNEMVQLRLVVENAQNVEQISPPAFSSFVLVSGPSQESGMTAVNGVVKQYVALSFVLKPKGPGTFTIAAGTARADGKLLKSNAVTVKVNNRMAPDAAANTTPYPGGFNPFEDMPQRPEPFNDYILKKGENATEKINRNMFVKLQTDKTSCYIGEPVTASYKLYTRLKSESNLIKNPSFSGFSVIDLQQPGNTSYTRETVNGREYNVYIIRKVQLYPLQAGTLELEPAEIENNVQFIKEAYASSHNNLLADVFSEFAEAAIPPEAIEIQKVILQNKPVFINVKALPAATVPAAFNGAVGNFSVKSGLEKNSFTTDDAGKLNVIIEGAGNLQLVTAPDISWPKGIDAFDPVSAEDIVKTTVPVSGRKMLSWDFTVSQPGDYVLPPVVFSYFNPATGKYITDSAPSIKFTVAKGTGKKPAAVVVKEEKKSGLNRFFSNRRWVISTVVTLIVLGLLFWLKRDKRLEEKARVETAAAAEKLQPVEIELPVIEKKNYLQEAAVLLNGDSIVFYKELNNALKDYLSHKLEMPAATINKKAVAEGLNKMNVSTDTIIQLQELMNDIELQLYAPFAEQHKMQELYDAADDMMRQLDTYKV
jgi:BatD DUF11 like domain